MARRATKILGASAVIGGLLLATAACGSSGGGDDAPPAGGTNGTSGVTSSAPEPAGTAGAGPSADWSTAQSASQGGGFDALVAAAKAEGTLNTIALPRDWANYGEIIDTFTKKYGIKVNSINPDGSSQDELNAIKAGATADTPDVLDVGNAYALSGAQDGLFAPYQVQTWDDIPPEQKDQGGLWFSDYGGYIAIGCRADKAGAACPSTFKELDNPAFKGRVSLNGDPSASNSAFMGLWAAALANGGSADDIQPGIDFFKKLKSEGIFNPSDVTPQTVASGATPIVIDWDYLNVANAQELKKDKVAWQTSVPADGLVSSYYAQAINRQAPHPAAARLWEEYLYSQDADGGQNGWLRGAARPVELVAMTSAGTTDKAAAAVVPQVSDTDPFVPTQDQITKAKDVVTRNWADAVK